MGVPGPGSLFEERNAGVSSCDVLKRRHVVVVVASFPARSETFVTQHVIGLIRRGYRVTVISRGVGEGISEDEVRVLDDKGVERYEFPAWRRGRLRHVAFLVGRLCDSSVLRKRIFNGGFWRRRELWFAAYCRDVLSRIDADVVHIHYGHLGGAMDFLGLPENTVVTWHGIDANVMPRKRGNGMYISLFSNTCMHTVGSAFMEDRLKRLGVRSSRLKRIPMGVDPGFFAIQKNISLNDGVFRVISVGRLDEMKGHSLLIEACSRLLDGGLKLELNIIGAGPLRDPLETQIRKTGHASKMKLLGALPHQEVRAWMEVSDVFALTGVVASNGRVETQGVAILEAQAAGLPVVVSNVGGVIQSMLPDRSGFLCSPGRVREVENALRRLAEDEELRERFSAAAVSFAHQYFSMDTMLDKFEELYSVALVTE